ncbi:hypothetical protein BKA70DRAFT_1233919 [Coprinopsis sp. MPI-PUGE-AT-0042]|nr:hypothetical protein BKA70DRAFT_1233919 [Coprinopsis sp. MPI-PUGE-AT-0042]
MTIFNYDAIGNALGQRDDAVRAESQVTALCSTEVTSPETYPQISSDLEVRIAALTYRERQALLCAILRHGATMDLYDDLVDTPACHVPSRSLLLPRILEAPKHPLHPSVNPGHTFVALIRATETAMEEMKRYEDGMSIPLGQRDELASQGLVEMVPGDYLFARDITGTGQPSDDILLAWAVGPGTYDDSELNDLEEATWQAIGDENARSPGTTRFETFKEAMPVQPGSRCYTLAQSFEAIPAIVAPCASGKWKGDGTGYLAIVRDLIKATSRLAMANMRCATPSIQEIIQERSNTLGLPRIGHDDNYAYPTIQCNIASASRSRSDLSKDMGDFGSAHRDERDSVGHFTNMIANSKLPSSYDPGYFHLLLLGVYVSLRSGIGFNFQGHWKHGGSAPTCLPNNDLDPSATCFVLVSYPPSGMVSNQVRHRVAELPRPDGRNDALYVTPEMKAVDPSYIGVHIDPIKFFQSFSYETPSGGRETVETWDFAPESRHGGAQAISKRSNHVKAEVRWKEHVEKTAKVVPYCFPKFSGVRELESNDVDMEEVGGLNTEQKDGQEKSQPLDPVVEQPSGEEVTGIPEHNPQGQAETSLSSSPSMSMEDVREGSPENSASQSESDTYNAEPSSKASDRSVQIEQATGNTESLGPDGTGKDDKSVAKNSKRKRDKQGIDGQDEQGHKRQNLDKKNFRFANLLTAATLEAEVHHLRRSTTDKFDVGDMAETADALVDAGERLDRRPFDPNALQTVCTLVRECKVMEEIQSSMSLEVRKARLRAIDAHVRIWRWLDGDVRVSVMDKLGGEAADAQFDLSWVARLADAVKMVYTARTAAKAFHPEDFGVNSHTEDHALRPYTLINDCQGRYPPEGKELAQLVGSSVVVIVSNWLGEHSDMEHKRAWFVDTIAEHIGQEVLTLDLTWNMVRNFKPIYVLPREQAYSRLSDQSLLEPFISVLQDHPITNPGSHEGQLYRLYCNLINECTSPLEVLDPLLDLSPAWHKFKEMLELSLEYLSSPSRTFQSEYQAKLKAEEDYYLPLRNDAISRRQSMSDNGPYAPSTIRQVHGIFSAIVWRACTYRSGFARDVGMVFNDWVHLDRSINYVIAQREDEMTRINAYFCKKDAYGQPAGRRSIEHAFAYWKTLQELNWDGFSASNPTFSQCMQFFRPPGKNISKRFPQLGPLGSFMLVGDLAYAGVCQRPTDLEAATYIVENGMGSLAGLKLLGLGPDDELKGRDQISATKRGLQDLLDMTYPLLKKLGYTGEIDFLLIEHMLCKFQRAVDQKLI